MTEEKASHEQKPAGNGTASGFNVLDSAMDFARRSREHAERYPFVWVSYLVSFGTVGGYAVYSWRRLRVAEASLRRLVERQKLERAAEIER
jgi:hypothetical protein